MGPSPFRKDLSGSCAKAVAMNKETETLKSLPKDFGKGMTVVFMELKRLLRLC